jgi:hypothetical protein
VEAQSIARAVPPPDAALGQALEGDLVHTTARCPDAEDGNPSGGNEVEVDESYVGPDGPFGAWICTAYSLEEGLWAVEVDGEYVGTIECLGDEGL